MTKRIARRAKQLLTEAEYAALLERQGGVCAICSNPPKVRRLSTDHDHATGEVRGLLCYRCNRALATYVGLRWLADAMGYLVAFEQRRLRAAQAQAAAEGGPVDV